MIAAQLILFDACSAVRPPLLPSFAQYTAKHNNPNGEDRDESYPEIEGHYLSPHLPA